MEERHFVWIMILVILFGSAVPAGAVTDDRESDALLSNLVVAYDFEGASRERQLSDKAPAGSVRDDLTIKGTVAIQNGVATVAADSGSKLEAENSEDFQNFTGYTVYLKVKATGEYGGNYNHPIRMTGLFRAFVNGKSGNVYSIGAQAKADKKMSHSVPGTNKMQEDQWFYLAYTAQIQPESGKIDLVTYYSYNGIDYAVASTSPSCNVDVLSMTATLLLGDKQDGSIVFSYDDVMLFNRALTETEIKSLSTLRISEDRIGLVGCQETAVSNGMFDVRFVSLIDSLDYEYIGYDIVVKANGTEQSVQANCKYVYDKIVGLGYEKTAKELGGKYLFALGLKNFDITDGEVIFEVTPYYVVGGEKTLLSTWAITYTDGVYGSAVNIR